MGRAKLTEAFQGEGGADTLEALNTRGNEMLTLQVKGGTLTFLTNSDESDDEAIRQSRFVAGEIQLENGKTFNFWLGDEGRGAITETAIYTSSKPQTG